MAELSRVCRNFDVLAALQSLGVYEVGVRVPKREEPTAVQSATYQAFLDREEEVCGNVVDALLRYYRHVRDVAPDWFEDDDYPDGRSVEDLAQCVDFDGIHICRISSQGLCPIMLGWEPAWDLEHKLAMTLFRDQVLEIFSAGEGRLLHNPEDYLTDPHTVWGVDQLNDSEREALQEFIDGFKPDASDQ